MKQKNIQLVVLFLAGLLLATWLSACTSSQDAETTSSTPVAVETVATTSSALDQFITTLRDAGVIVANEGQQPQGLFDSAIRWRLTINGTAVNVFEFADVATRRAISDNISPDGSIFTITDGDTQIVTHWDYEGIPHFWTMDTLLVEYSSQDAAIIDLLNRVLGEPIADGSRPYRLETPGTGVIAGITQHGVSFKYDPYLAADIQAEVVTAVTDEQVGGFTQLVIPDHLVFTFLTSYAGAQTLYRQAANLSAEPHIAVYPARAYAAMNFLAREQIEGLQTLLAERPADPGDELPFLPTVNASRALHIQLAYLEFANGAGVRYLTQVAQEARPVNNQELFYTFQGLTDDGAYYVAAFFPVTTSILPDTPKVADDDAFNANFSTYLVETTAALNQLSPADFMPDLTLLDAVMTSLRVEPDVELRGGETAMSAAGPTSPLVAPPPGLIYRTPTDGLWRVDASGQPQLLTDRSDALPAPNAVHAVYMDEDRHLWLINLADGSESQLAKGVELSGFYRWGDAHTLLPGVWLTPEESEGPNNGHMARLDIETGVLQILDEQYLSIGRPALAPDGQTIAYDVSPTGPNRLLTGRIYHPDRGSQPFDPDLFKGTGDILPGILFNPAWSPDGNQLAWISGAGKQTALLIFDLTRHTVKKVHGWDPARFGALIPSPVWSPDGQWLALEIWANGPEGSGLWLLAVDGSAEQLIDPTGGEPHWLGPYQLIYADFDENRNSTTRQYDLISETTTTLDLPAGSTVLLTP